MTQVASLNQTDVLSPLPCTLVPLVLTLHHLNHSLILHETPPLPLLAHFLIGDKHCYRNTNLYRYTNLLSILIFSLLLLSTNITVYCIYKKKCELPTKGSTYCTQSMVGRCHGSFFFFSLEHNDVPTLRGP